mgnify:CR=1 FL=1
MTGPVAPRDPEKARAYFYIMRGKEICGLKQGDGKAVQFIYESDGRLANSAQIVGNITDSRILELLGTVKGFRTLVHSIGVSVEMEHPAENIPVLSFYIQIKGGKDRICFSDVRQKGFVWGRNESGGNTAGRWDGTEDLSVGL